MHLNVKKTKELVFHRPNPRFSLPDPLPHIERVNGLKLLGVFVNANFKFDEHVNKSCVFAASACTSSNSLSLRDLVSNSCILS